MSRPLVAVMIVCGFGGCTRPSDYVFSDERGRMCFTPCKAFHGACLAKCSYASTCNYRHHTVMDTVFDVFAGATCQASCRDALHTCAEDCGGAHKGARRPRLSRAALEERQRALHAQLEHARWESLSAARRQDIIGRCKHLHQSLGDPRPALEKFVSRCRALNPEVIACLDAGRGHDPSCKAAYLADNPVAVREMNELMRDARGPRDPAVAVTSKR